MSVLCVELVDWIPHGCNWWCFVSCFSVVRSTLNSMDCYSKCRQMDWLGHRKGNAVSMHNKRYSLLVSLHRSAFPITADCSTNLTTAQTADVITINTYGCHRVGGLSEALAKSFICHVCDDERKRTRNESKMKIDYISDIFPDKHKSLHVLCLGQPEKWPFTTCS